jgi:hypothetical protein
VITGAQVRSILANMQSMDPLYLILLVATPFLVGVAWPDPSLPVGALGAWCVYALGSMLDGTSLAEMAFLVTFILAPVEIALVAGIGLGRAAGLLVHRGRG